MNISSAVMLGVTIFFALIIAICALVGFFKGWKKCLLGLCRTVVALLFAFVAVFAFCRIVPAESLYAVLESFVGELPYISDSAAIQELGGAVIYTIIMPFAFAFIFVVIDLLLLIPAYIIGRALDIYTKKEDKAPAGNSAYNFYGQTQAPAPKKSSYSGLGLLGHFGGAGIRIVTTFAVILVLLMPLSSIIHTLTDGLMKVSDTVHQENIDLNIGKPNISFLEHDITDEEGKLCPDEISGMIDEYIAPVHTNFFLSAANCKPIRLMSNLMINTKDSTGGARNEIAQLFDVACNAIYFAVDPDTYGEKQKAAVDNIIGYISESELHSRVVADAVSMYTNDISANGKSPFGTGDIAIIGDPLFEILKNTTAESIRADFDTLSDIIGIMIDYKLPAKLAAAIESTDEEELLTAFSDEEMLYNIMSSIYANDDYRHMLAPIIDYAFTVVIHQFDPDSERLYVAEVREEYTDEGLRNEAKIFSGIFSDAAAIMKVAPELVEAENAFDTIAKIDVAVIGGVIDNSRDSRLIGKGVTQVMIALLETTAFDSMREVADILIKHIGEDDDLNMVNLLGAVQQFVKIVGLYEDSSETDTAAMAAALRELNKSCDENTAAILKEIIDDSNILNAAVLSSGDAQKNESAVKVLNVLLDQLTTGEFTEEEFEQEAKAVDYAMKLVQANSNEAIKEICGDKEDRREMIETISDSKIASAALIEMAYEDGDTSKPMTEDALKLKESLDENDIENVRAECKEYYIEQVKSGDDTAQLEDNIKAISAIFDGKISDEDLAAWAAEAKNGGNAPEISTP